MDIIRGSQAYCSRQATLTSLASKWDFYGITMHYYVHISGIIMQPCIETNLITWEKMFTFTYPSIAFKYR